jgi:hypothetical protein
MQVKYLAGIVGAALLAGSSSNELTSGARNALLKISRVLNASC